MWYVCKDRKTGDVRRVIELATQEKADVITKYILELIDEKDVPMYKSQIKLNSFDNGPTVSDRVTVLEGEVTKIDTRVKTIESIR